MWQIDKQNRFIIKKLADEAIIFDRYSGSTHLLDTLSSEILTLLQSQPHGLGDLAQNLKVKFEFPSDKVLNFSLEQHLLSLSSQGFIVNYPSDTFPDLPETLSH